LKPSLVYTLIGLVLAHSILAPPLVLVVPASAIKCYVMNREQVARSLRTLLWKVFLTVTLPRIRFAVATSALLAFL